MKRTFAVSERYTDEALTQVGASTNRPRIGALKAMSPDYLRKSADFVVETSGLR
jgi:hypothetical protein